MIRCLIILAFVLVSVHGAVPLDNTRSLDLRGLIGVEGGIPIRTNVWTNYTTASTSAEIQADLNNSVPLNSVVTFMDTNSVYHIGGFDLGTFGFTHGNQLTLRGAGPGRTIIQPTNATFSSGGFAQWRSPTRRDTVLTDTNFVRNWTGGYSQGVSNITILTDGTTPYSSQYNLKVGTVIVLDQRDDPSLGLNDYAPDGAYTLNNYQMLRQDTTNSQSCTITAGTNRVTATAHGYSLGDRVIFSASVFPTITTYSGALAPFTGYWVINVIDANTFQIDANPPGSATAIKFTSTGTSVTVAKRVAGRIQTEYTRVKAISGGTNLTIWPPIMSTNWQASLAPQVWWWGDSIESVGIEDMTIDLSKCTNSSGTTHDQAAFFEGVVNGWMKNVEVKYARKGIAGTWEVLNITISGGFGNQPLYTGGPPDNHGSSQYGLDLAFGSGFLIENCAWSGWATPINIDSGASLGAVAYCFMTNDVYLSGFFMGAAIQSHGLGAWGWTVEGNYGPGLNFDFIHGTSMFYGTSYKNRWLGYDPASLGPNNANTFAIFNMGTNRFNQAVGDYLGYAGYHVNETWMFGTLDPAYTPKTEIRVGFNNNNGTTANGQGDAGTVSTFWRDGNYSTVAGAVRWDGSDSNHTFPDTSRVYVGTNAPSWWTATNRYPSVNVLATPMAVDPPIKTIIDSGTFGGGGGGTTGGGGGTTGGSSASGTVRFSGVVNIRTQ